MHSNRSLVQMPLRSGVQTVLHLAAGCVFGLSPERCISERKIKEVGGAWARLPLHISPHLFHRLHLFPCLFDFVCQHRLIDDNLGLMFYLFISYLCAHVCAVFMSTTSKHIKARYIDLGCSSLLFFDSGCSLFMTRLILLHFQYIL